MVRSQEPPYLMAFDQILSTFPNVARWAHSERSGRICCLMGIDHQCYDFLRKWPIKGQCAMVVQSLEVNVFDQKRGQQGANTNGTKGQTQSCKKIHRRANRANCA